MPVILLEEPEARTRRLLQRYLTGEGFTVRPSLSPRETLALAGSFRPGAMLIGDGAAALRELRKEAFAAGADCWLPRPPDPEEIALLLWALCRRWGSGLLIQIQLGDLLLNEQTRELRREGGEGITLSPREYGLMALFLAHPRRIFTRQELLDHLWEPASESGPRAVDVAIRRLRARCGSGWGFAIQAVPGLGYRLVVEEPVAK